MLTLIGLIIALVAGVVTFALKLSWGIVKFIFGLGLFVLCPVLVIWIIVAGFFGIGLIPALILACIFGIGFKRH